LHLVDPVVVMAQTVSNLREVAPRNLGVSCRELTRACLGRFAQDPEAALDRSAQRDVLAKGSLPASRDLAISSTAETMSAIRCRSERLTG
jgi:hypothetical protein